MRTTWFRIISVIALIAIVTMFSGLASTIDAAQTITLAATSDNHCNPGNPHECPIPCETVNAESLNKLRQNTADLRAQLQAKDLELRRLNGDEAIDVRHTDELEADIRGIKKKLRSVAKNMNLEVCNCLNI